MNSLKQEFLKKWIEGLQRCSSRMNNMSMLERNKAIKLSADVAMASARKGTTCWSRALIANASKDEIIKGPESENNKRRMICRRSMKILKRSRTRRIRRASKCGTSSNNNNNIAERLVRKRTQVLKSLIPGGESMNDEVSLIEETLDYIISLSAQVDVMQSLVNVSELVNNHN